MLKRLFAEQKKTKWINQNEWVYYFIFAVQRCGFSSAAGLPAREGSLCFVMICFPTHFQNTPPPFLPPQHPPPKGKTDGSANERRSNNAIWWPRDSRHYLRVRGERSRLTAALHPLIFPRIKHPNIVSLEDIFESTSHLYLVMQLWVPLPYCPHCIHHRARQESD